MPAAPPEDPRALNGVAARKLRFSGCKTASPRLGQGLRLDNAQKARWLQLATPIPFLCVSHSWKSVQNQLFFLFVIVVVLRADSVQRCL